MTLTELVEELARRTGAEHEVAWGFSKSLIDLIVERLDQGHEVKIRELGTFKWVDVPSKTMPGGKRVQAGRKLRFMPADRFRTRRVDDD